MMNLIAPTYDAYGYRKADPAFDRLMKMFSAVVPGGNYYTPQLLGYVELPNGVVEVSKGKQPFASMSHKDMYGVTVVQDGKRNKEMSTSLGTYAEVVAHVSKLSINQ